MNDSDHCAGRAMFLAALDDTDPERRAAVVHARGCANCSRALADAGRLLRELDVVASPDAPSPQALEVTLRAVRALDEDAARSRLSRRTAALTLLAGTSLALVSKHSAAEPSWTAFALVLGVATVLPTATELAALAAAGSLAGGAALIVACPAGHALEHLFAFHTGGALLALLAGFIAYPLLRSEAT